MISRNKLKWTLLALPLLASSISSAMADSLAGPSGELIVTGVYKPEACFVTLANHGTVDYGRMPAATLSATDYTTLPIKTLTNAITINCPNMTSVGITSQDNRAATAIYGDNVFDPARALPISNSFGIPLGLGVDSASNKIGNYISQLQNLKHDGADGYFGSFATTPFVPTQVAGLKPALAVGEPSTGGQINNLYDSAGAVLNAKLYTMDYSVSAQIAPIANLNLSRDIVLDGSVTISFYYL